MKNKINSDFLMPLIKQYKSGGNVLDSLEKGMNNNSKDLSELFIKFLWVRDQAHVFHWQTKLNAEHVTLGQFYDDYLDEIDELAESIFGKYGKTFKVGKYKIELVDYSEINLKKYLDELTFLFTKEFKLYFPNTIENIDLYHIIGDILELVNKLKYLLSQK